MNYSNPVRKHAQRAAKKLERIRVTLERLSYPTLLELARRGATSLEPDVYHSKLTVGSRGSFGPSVVEQAIERDLPPDPVGAYLKEIDHHINEMCARAHRIDFIMHVLTRGASAPQGGGRGSSLQAVCQVEGCTEAPTGLGEDRLKAGFCPKHYTAWRRYVADHPSSDPGATRHAFLKERAQVSEDRI